MSGKYQRFFWIFILAITVGISSPVKTGQCDQSTVLYMSFDEEPDGEVVQDESDYENHGNIVGGGVEWIDDGKFGGALEFNGSSKIEILHSDSLDLDEEMRSEEHTSELQSHSFISYAVFCLKKKNET